MGFKNKNKEAKITKAFGFEILKNHATLH